MKKRRTKKDYKPHADGLHRESQAALEFLMTYGWVIMVALIAIGTLAYFGVLSPDRFIPERCVLEAGIGCTDFVIKDTFVDFVLRNGQGEDISINNISITGCNGTTSGALSNGAMQTIQSGGTASGHSASRILT